jgi:FkbM family methyltransferase
LVTAQRVLIRLHTAGVLPDSVSRFLNRRTWIVEKGAAAGLKLAFPQNLDYILGSSEPPVQEAILRSLVPSGVFYDVGANVGFFSLLAARRVETSGFVYAFEPLRENALAIRQNAILNALANLSVFEVAAAEHSGIGELCLTGWDGGCSLSSAEVVPVNPLQRRPVRVVALDDLIESGGLRPPTVVKIDVEGVELGVLKGMVKTLQSYRPVIIYEVDDGDKAAFDHRWHLLDQFVAALGYEVTHLERSYPHLKWWVGHSLAIPSNAS